MNDHPGSGSTRERHAARSGTVRGILSRLMALRPALPSTAARIADVVLQQPEEIVHMSITEVAERASASEGSVVALCRQVGARGFQDLKISLAQDLVQPIKFIHEDVQHEDPPATIVEKIFHSDIQALRDTLTALDLTAMEQAVTALRGARRVEIYGIGSAAPIAEDAHYRMLRIGIDCRVAVDSHVQAISASLAGPDVATLTVSHSGSTKETVLATQLAREAGATTIVITNYGKSPIQAFADVVLHTVARETRFRTEAMTSRIAQLAIVDALIACLAIDRYETSIATIQKTFDVLSAKRY